MCHPHLTVPLHHIAKNSNLGWESGNFIGFEAELYNAPQQMYFKELFEEYLSLMGSLYPQELLNRVATQNH